MNKEQCRKIIADVKAATRRDIPAEAVRRVLKGDYQDSHPIDAAILASARKHIKKAMR